jgi:four helix bundle protein
MREMDYSTNTTVVMALLGEECFLMGNFRKLRAWQAAEELTIHIHRLTRTMRGARSATLCDQLIRASMSVPINIVEGNAHRSLRERARFFGYALASLWEVEGHIQLSSDLDMMSKKDHEALLEETINVRRMLYGLLKKERTWDEPKPPMRPGNNR